MKRKEIDEEMNRINTRMSELEQKKKANRTEEEKKEMRILRGELAGMLDELNVNQVYRLYDMIMREEGWAHEVWKVVQRINREKVDEWEYRYTREKMRKH